jgi:hypothetical protein
MDPNDAAALLDRVSKRARELGISTLSPSEGIIFCVDWLDFEVVQGGLETFYMNTTGDHADITVEALEAIGATECAAGLRSLHTLFPAVRQHRRKLSDMISWPSYGRRMGSTSFGSGTGRFATVSMTCGKARQVPGPQLRGLSGRPPNNKMQQTRSGHSRWRPSLLILVLGRRQSGMR